VLAKAGPGPLCCHLLKLNPDPLCCLGQQVPAKLNLGPLVELVVGHDQAGGGADAWHLDYVEVVDPSGKVGAHNTLCCAPDFASA